MLDFRSHRGPSPSTRGELASANPKRRLDTHILRDSHTPVLFGWPARDVYVSGVIGYWILLNSQSNFINETLLKIGSRTSRLLPGLPCVIADLPYLRLLKLVYPSRRDSE